MVNTTEKVRSMKRSARTTRGVLFLLLTCIICIAILGTLSSCGRNISVSSGNISNFGYVLVDDGNIYYTKIVESALGYYSNIYKYNIKTQSEILVASTEAYYHNEMNGFLAMDNGELYFLTNYLNDSIIEASVNISKITPDGKNIEPTLLFDEEISCTFLQIVNGIIYYYDDMDQAIYKMNTDGTNKMFICDALVSGIAVDKGNIYYAEYDTIMKVSTKGGEPTIVYEFSDEGLYIESIVLDGNYIYYLDDSYSLIGRMKTDGSKNQTVYTAGEQTNEYIEYFNVNRGVVYIVAENYAEDAIYSVLSVTPGNKTVKQIVSHKSELGDISPLAIWNDTIYFTGMPMSDTILDSVYVWFTVKKSGGILTPFQPLSEYSDKFEELLNK